jgi:hypothetical protein
LADLKKKGVKMTSKEEKHFNQMTEEGKVEIIVTTATPHLVLDRQLSVISPAVQAKMVQWTWKAQKESLGRSTSAQQLERVSTSFPLFS